MIIDSSAIIAILHREPKARVLAARMSAAPVCRISAATYLETGIVLWRDRTGASRQALDALLQVHNAIIEPVTAEHARLGLEAFERFGKGTGHRAGLNFGDCFAYALAKAMGEPLLFKGDDFPHTDVVPAC